MSKYSKYLTKAQSAVGGFWGQNRFKIMLTVLPLACLIAFFAMDFSGATAFLSQFGEWIIAQLMNIYSLGVAGVWWSVQAATATVVNIFVGVVNAVIGFINQNVIGMVKAWPEIPFWSYITSPEASTTFKQILSDMGYQNQQLLEVGGQYVQNVSSSPLQSAAVGLGSGGATLVTTYTLLDQGSGGGGVRDGGSITGEVQTYTIYDKKKNRKYTVKGVYRDKITDSSGKTIVGSYIETKDKLIDQDTGISVKKGSAYQMSGQKEDH